MTIGLLKGRADKKVPLIIAFVRITWDAGIPAAGSGVFLRAWARPGIWLGQWLVGAGAGRWRSQVAVLVGGRAVRSAGRWAGGAGGAAVWMGAR